MCPRKSWKLLVILLNYYKFYGFLFRKFIASQPWEKPDDDRNGGGEAGPSENSGDGARTGQLTFSWARFKTVYFLEQQ